MTNEEVIRRIRTTRKLLLTIRKQRLEFWGQKIRKETLKNLTPTGKKSRRKLFGNVLNKLELVDKIWLIVFAACQQLLGYLMLKYLSFLTQAII